MAELRFLEQPVYHSAHGNNVFTKRRTYCYLRQRQGEECVQHPYSAADSAFQKKLRELRKQQKEDQRLFGNCYNRKYLGYVYVNEIGELIKPDYITEAFSNLLKKNGLRHIRFHDTRHSCASLLLRNGVAMKDIQAWLGHSDYSTTANLYAHLEMSESVQRSASRLNSGLFHNAADLSELPTGDDDLEETG